MKAQVSRLMATHAGAIAGVTVASLALAAMGWLAVVDPTQRLVARQPGMDGRSQARSEIETVKIGEFFERFDGIAGGPVGTWSGFRGTGRDNVVPAEALGADRWESGPPRQLWSVALGEGHAGPAVADGRVFVLDYDEVRRGDALRSFSLADGREIWRRWHRVRVKRNHGFSRTVPAIEGRHVVALGPRGHVLAVDAQTGDLRWSLDLEREYGSVIPLWYSGQCPLIDRGVVVLAPAGKALMIGVDCATGRVLWSVPNPHGWQMSHTSVMRMQLAGRNMYVYSALGGMAGVAADGAERGRVLWETTLWSQSVLAPSPLILPDGHIFVTAGYGAGSMMLKVSGSDAGFTVSEVARFSPSDGLASEQQTPVLFRGHIFGIEPKDAGALRNQLVCYRADDVKTPVWVSGPTSRFGLGPYLISGDRILVLNDDGVLTLAEATPRGYRQLAQAKVLDGVDAWAPMALVGGRLLLRDSRRLLCLQLGHRGATGGQG
jgi:outer membrane protein assembly factor BamB